MIANYLLGIFAIAVMLGWLVFGAWLCYRLHKDIHDTFWM